MEDNVILERTAQIALLRSCLKPLQKMPHPVGRGISLCFIRGPAAQILPTRHPLSYRLSQHFRGINPRLSLSFGTICQLSHGKPKK